MNVEVTKENLEAIKQANEVVDAASAFCHEFIMHSHCECYEDIDDDLVRNLAKALKLFGDV